VNPFVEETIMAVRTWIRNLFAPGTPVTVRKTPSFRPTLAALEQRDCPAAALFSAGQLTVTGSAPAGENISVVTQGRDMVVLDSGHEILRHTASEVTTLSITTGAGPDHVTVNLTETGNVLAQSLHVQIDTGAGDDVVNCTCTNLATTVHSEVNLGAGNDHLVGTSINSAPTAKQIEQIDGGTGDDVIECVQVNPAGTVNTTMIGGDGNDVLFGHLIGSQPTANLTFNALGGNGDDAINLLAEGTVQGQLAFAIQGGSGNDQIGLAFNLAGPSTPGTLPPSTVAVQGSIDAGQGDDQVTLDPGNPYNLAQVQFPELLQFNGGQGTDELNVAGGIPLNMLPVSATNFEVV
jgi:hypothetical protein